MRSLQAFDLPIRGDLPWWVLYTRHQHEKVVAEILTAKGLEVFLPLYTSQRRWKDRSKILSLPLFPCYVFVRGGLEHRLPVVTTPGVHMILCRGDQIAIIPEAEIDAIRKVVEGPCRVEPYPYLNCGERIRVTRGPLEGVQGILVRRKNLYRLVLSVDMLIQSVAVEVDALDVEPAPARDLAGAFSAQQCPGAGKSYESLLPTPYRNCTKQAL
jgi:transcription antitermination factor NusG